MFNDDEAQDGGDAEPVACGETASEVQLPEYTYRRLAADF